INNAPDLTTLEKIADTFQNNYSEIGKVMKSYVVEAESVDPARRLDFVKARIRVLIDDYVAKEYECYRQYPRPWSLRLGAFYSSSVFTNISPLRISLDPNDLFENASYERNRFGLSVGTQHTFLLNWAHYHVYSPSWAIASRPSALANNAVFREVDLGWQFKSSLRNGLIYSTIDNVFTPTEGLELNFEVENVGQVLGGDDHFNRYTASTKYYWWWFDFTFGGFFRRNVLRRWRVVQEFRLYGIFSHETVPYGRDQDPEKNPYMEPEDRQYLGGTTILRGYDQVDTLYPAVWQDGGNHMIFGGTELRIPIEPTIVWLAVFFDWGTLFDNLGEYTGDLQDDADSYEQTQRLSSANTDPLLAYLADRYDPFSFFTQPYHYESQTDWNNPKRAVLSQRNLALDRALYSWGFGLRIQIPVLPLRLFLAQKLYYKGNGVFAPIPGNEEFEFVFGIGDQRF
ncbi:MAG: BamA/TamA family outer membrane protein, partial [Leptospiraceae bacterium]|nr:BamA/TamA family outer membrane protein [Leptospiraceae bacterium]